MATSGVIDSGITIRDKQLFLETDEWRELPVFVFEDYMLGRTDNETINLWARDAETWKRYSIIARIDTGECRLKVSTTTYQMPGEHGIRFLEVIQAIEPKLKDIFPAVWKQCEDAKMFKEHPDRDRLARTFGLML